MNADVKLEKRKDLENLEIGIKKTANLEVLGSYFYRGFHFLRIKLPISISVMELRRSIKRFEGIVEVLEAQNG